jgi:predicted metalloprotease
LPKASAATRAARSPPAGATTVNRAFLETTFDDVQRFWDREFSSAGVTYAPARLRIFNHGIYLDVGFFDLLARRAGLGGFAQAYVIGHEFGHHVQELLGIHGRVGEANQANPAGQNARP